MKKLTRKHKHHIAISAAVGAVTLAHYMLPVGLEHLSPLAGFIGNLIWIWSE